jgi:hypothetical protein
VRHRWEISSRTCCPKWRCANGADLPVPVPARRLAQDGALLSAPTRIFVESVQAF